MGFQKTEADTCRALITPALQAAGWDTAPSLISEQHFFTDGRIVINGRSAKRRVGKRADYILRFNRDLPLAVVEAKAEGTPAGEGMAQAREYAQILGLRFAYATNGRTILEFDAAQGTEKEVGSFPSPSELWTRFIGGTSLSEEAARKYSAPFNALDGKRPRYYQEIAINRAVESVLSGRNRVLLTMATGTGKTYVAFQICWKLWSSKWTKRGENRRPRVLFIADRNILVDDPKDKTFAIFGDARWKIEGNRVNKSREIYFSTYQSLAEDERRDGLYKQYPSDFFDLIIIDECHRGSARDTSTWRSILNHFKSATQLGLTATPLRDESRDTYAYFGAPIYEYSLRQGIDDGFLAPYRVHRVLTTYDAVGWRPTKGQLDRYGHEIPDADYSTADFERLISLRARTQAVAKHLTSYLKRTDRFAKTIVFCVDQEHADEMRRALVNENSDIVKDHADYVCRVTSADGDIGRAALSRYQELETATPTILTTSQLLTTGVDAPTTKNVVLVRMIGSMSEFKQIIGRGTRVRQDYGKLFFDIFDYTGSATRLFADPAFDGTPSTTTEQPIDDDGNPAGEEVETEPTTEVDFPLEPEGESSDDDGPPKRRKYYVDGGRVEIEAHIVYELDSQGKQLRVIQFTDYTGENIRTMYRSPAELAEDWGDSARRDAIIEALGEKGISVDQLTAVTGRTDADMFDLLCHIAYERPVLSRSERVNRVKALHAFDSYGEDARAVIDALLEKYRDHGIAELQLPVALQTPPISSLGNVSEIASRFGGVSALSEAIARLNQAIYST